MKENAMPDSSWKDMSHSIDDPGKAARREETGCIEHGSSWVFLDPGSKTPLTNKWWSDLTPSAVILIHSEETILYFNLFHCATITQWTICTAQQPTKPRAHATPSLSPDTSPRLPWQCKLQALWDLAKRWIVVFYHCFCQELSVSRSSNVAVEPCPICVEKQTTT